jgi:hypothetical protein
MMCEIIIGVSIELISTAVLAIAVIVFRDKLFNFVKTASQNYLYCAEKIPKLDVRTFENTNKSETKFCFINTGNISISSIRLFYYKFVDGNKILIELIKNVCEFTWANQNEGETIQFDVNEFRKINFDSAQMSQGLLVELVTENNLIFCQKIYLNINEIDTPTCELQERLRIKKKLPNKGLKLADKWIESYEIHINEG